MSPTVILEVINGSDSGESFSFNTEQDCLVGRASDCDIKVPDDAEHIDVSRHHCVMHIAPPLVWLRDLNSKNGTYVNNEPVAQTSNHIVILHDGDDIRLGQLELKVHVIIDDTDNHSPVTLSNSEWIT